MNYRPTVRKLLLAVAAAVLTAAGMACWAYQPPPPPPLTFPQSRDFVPSEFSPDGSLLLGRSTDDEGTVCFVWDIAYGRLRNKDQQSFGEPDEFLPPSGQAAGFTPDGRIALVIPDRRAAEGRPVEAVGGTLWLRDVRIGSELAVPVRGLRLDSPLAFTTDGDLVAAHDARGRLRAWEVATGKSWTVWPDGDPATRPEHFRFSAHGGTLGVFFPDGTVRFWDCRTQTLGEPVQVPDTRRPLYGSLSPDLRKVLTFCPQGGNLRHVASEFRDRWPSPAEWMLWSLTPGQRRARFEVAASQRPVLFDGYGRVLTWEEVPRRESLLGFCKRPASDLVYRDVESGEVVATVPGGKEGLLSADRRAFAARMEDGTIQLWHVPASAFGRLWVEEVVAMAVAVGLVAGVLTWWLSPSRALSSAVAIDSQDSTKVCSALEGRP
jgi:hypothetical protein